MTLREVFTVSLFVLETLACIAGFANRKRFAHPAFWWMPVYLLVITVSEILNYAAAKLGFAHTNALISQVLTPLQFLFIFWFITRFLPLKRNMVYVVLSAIYLMALSADQWYFKGQENVFMSFSYSVGNILLLLAIIAFFLSFSATEQILEFKKSAIFWIAVGFIVYYLSTFPYYALFNYWWTKKIHFAYQYFYASMVASCLMYGLFTYSFLKCK